MHVMRTEDYRGLVAKLAAIVPNEFEGGLANQIKIVLGECGDIWPACILDDMVGDEAAED